jgi:hypothetical protein
MTPSRTPSPSRPAPSLAPAPAEPDSRPPSPPPSRSGGQTRSGSSSAGSSAPSGFVADPGPAFDARRAPAAPEIEEPELPLEEWDEERIREFFMMGSETLHWMLRVGPEDEETFKATERDLDAMVPPATRIANRYDAIRAAAAAGDEVLLAAALTRYGLRNYARRRRLLAALAAAPPQPASGEAALPDTGPDTDPGWQRVHGDPFLGAPPDITPKGARR